MYEVNRSRFVELMNRHSDMLELVFSQFEEGSLSKVEDFVFIRCEDDVTILDASTLDSTPRYVNWYKLYHVGRCVRIMGFTEESHLIDFLDQVYAALKKGGRERCPTT